VVLSAPRFGFRDPVRGVPHPCHGADSRRPRLSAAGNKIIGLTQRIGYTAAGASLDKIGETKMAVDGNWNIVMSTPMGERKASLTLKNAGAR